LPLIIWNKIDKIRYKSIFSVLLFIAITLQIFIGLFDFFSRDPRINQIKVLWLFDVPNLLSIVIMLLLMVLVMKRKEPLK
jgi:hypothetical protein